MALGFFIEKNILKRIFYIVMILISLSRTGIVALILCLIYIIFENRKKFFNIKSFAKIFILIFIFIMGLNTIKPLKYKSQIFISRFNFTNQNIMNDGTGRHIYYYPMALEVIFEKSNLIQILFGYGPRVSGIAFSNDRDISAKLLVDNSSDTPWSVESDIVALLVGHGVIGLFIYLFMICRNIYICKINGDKEFEYMNLILLFAGITYGFYSILFSNILFIMSQIVRKNTEKIKDFNKNVI
ncbi:O-antigen ligase family protein [Clostridium tyrobutyricum]|uniref:O-antigen ligase family protein n=1 Tax=Clostridium tyrobutyricum TaxID=1519 RepID=UPI00136339FF|nr:O-antigen ligase family protein [Clostridium tyrobutyricum]